MLHNVSIRSKISMVLTAVIVTVFFTVQTLAVMRIIPAKYEIAVFGFFCCVAFVPFFTTIASELIIIGRRESAKKRSYSSMLNESSLVSKTDSKGKITEVNDKFCVVSGYKAQELLGQDHRMLNSGVHPKEFWLRMYQTTVKHRAVWHDIVTNRRKDGSHYHVKSWITAEFDEKGKLTGFFSVRQDVTDLVETLADASKKYTYLEHAAKILRHDMHSGINTYLPRGIKSLERRMPLEEIDRLKLAAPIKLIKDGLEHTQRVYRGVFEFTNLVREDAELDKGLYNIRDSLDSYLNLTSYSDQVQICPDLPNLHVNEALFCTAIDNMIRNGLKYNDSKTKWVKIYMVDDQHLGIEDNGRGLSQEDFDNLSKPYARKKEQKESGTGLGLNITTAILKEHGFSISCQKLESGTLMKVRVK
jgi:PAS domain S-box-containing protein